MDDSGAFSVDFVAAYSIMALLIICAFFTASNAISVRYTAGYSSDLAPLAGSIGDMLLRSTGEPSNWYLDPDIARGAQRIGLSSEYPNVISEERIQGLYFYDPPGLKAALGLSDPDDDYGLRLEIRSSDGSIAKSAGYPLPPDTRDVWKSARAAAIEEPDGTYRSAMLTVYMWRHDVGTASADE